MKIDQKLLSSLSNRVYIFSVDTIGFVKSLRKAGIESAQIYLLLKKAGELSTTYLDVEDVTDNKEFEKKISECKTFATIALDLLQKIEVNKPFLNEKVNLTIEVSEFVKIFGKILEDLKS
jgi:hypothetical protein